MKSVKEVATETKILERLENFSVCKQLAEVLFADKELQEMQEYANNVSIKRLGYNDHGPVHMRQVVINAIKMLKILNESGIKTSLEEEETGTFEDSLCAVVIAGLMHDLGMMTGRQGHEEMSVMLALPLIDKKKKKIFGEDIHKRVIIKSLAVEATLEHMSSGRIQ